MLCDEVLACSVHALQKLLEQYLDHEFGTLHQSPIAKYFKTDLCNAAVLCHIH